MSTSDPTSCHGNPEAKATSPRQPVENLLIVEPEALIRWSLETYLAKWFVVHPAASKNSADLILNSHRIDAAVVSADLPDRGAEQIETRVKSHNPHVRLVCTVTNPPGQRACCRGIPCLEKPFDLGELATLLRIPGAAMGDRRAEAECSSKTT